MPILDMKPAQLDVTATAGKTWTINIAFPDGTDLFGYHCTWQLRTRKGASGDPVLEASDTDGGLVIGEDTITLTLEPEDTDIPAGVYVHEFELEEPSGGKPAFLSGQWIVGAEVVA